MTFFIAAFTLVFSYLLGSVPTALLVSRRVAGLDIRCVGDGNMGARNTFHAIGPRFGLMVAAIDFAKGALPVWLAGILGLGTSLQIAAGLLAIVGHDFPVFAGFRGGQGTATSMGTMLSMFPWPTIAGLGIFAILFPFVRRSNVACGVGGATIALILCFSRQWLLLLYTVVVFLFVPIKLLMDSPRRRAIEAAGG